MLSCKHNAQQPRVFMWKSSATTVVAGGLRAATNFARNELSRLRGRPDLRESLVGGCAWLKPGPKPVGLPKASS